METIESSVQFTAYLFGLFTTVSLYLYSKSLSKTVKKRIVIN